MCRFNTALKVLLLGGTGDALRLARRLHADTIDVIYSIAGLVRKPALECAIRIGGYSSNSMSGRDGLHQFLQQEKIDLVVDATHPYAAQISSNAVLASRDADVPVWRYNRDPWAPELLQGAYSFTKLNQLPYLLTTFKKPFFTLGGSFLKENLKVPVEQKWLVRVASDLDVPSGVKLIKSIGPHTFESELNLMHRYGIDALITKNSGGDSAKLEAARKLQIQVFIQTRPELLCADWQSSRIDLMHKHIIDFANTI